MFRALVVALMLTTPAYAGADCGTLQSMMTSGARVSAHEGGYTMRLSGRAADDYLASMNSHPPITQYSAESLFLVITPHKGVVVVSVWGDKACIDGRIGPDVHEQALRATGEDI